MIQISTSKAPAAIGPYSQAIEQSIKNLQAILEEGGSSLGKVLKTTVFLADMGDFGAMNEVYSEYFKAPFPARCAFAVKALPKDAMVEIECVAAL